MMTETMKIWLKKLYLDAAEEHLGAASNEHIWALGSDTQEGSAQHEMYADENRAFACMLQAMAEQVDGIKTSAGMITTHPYDDGIAKGLQILLDDTIVTMLDVYEPSEGETEGEARVLVYKKEYTEDEEEAPIECITINR